jgi:hypothetical protein
MSGIVISLSSWNGLGNFPVGCFLSACLSLSMLGPSLIKIKLGGACEFRVCRKRDWEIPTYLPILLITCLIMSKTSFTFFYGQSEDVSFQNSTLMDIGIFKGLRTDSDTSTYLKEMTAAINEQGKCGNKILVLGSGPAIYLLTPMIPRALTTMSIVTLTKNFATDFEIAFFSRQENKPDVLIVNKTAALTNFDLGLIAQYKFKRKVVVGTHVSQIYTSVSCEP